MDLEDDVGAARDDPPAPFGCVAGRDPGRPAAESGIRQLHDLAAPPAGEARRGVGLLAAAGVAGLVQVDPAVMHDPAIPGMEFQAGDRDVVIERHRQGEAPIRIEAVERQVPGLGHRQDQVGRSERPAVGELRHGRQVGRVALGAARLGPSRQDFLLEDREPRRVEEDAGAGCAFHGGIWPDSRHLADEIGTLRGVAVGQQGERPDVAGPMAARTVVPEDRRDVLVERDRLAVARAAESAGARGVP